MARAVLALDGRLVTFTFDGSTVTASDPSAGPVAELVTRAAPLLDPNDPAELAELVEAVAATRTHVAHVPVLVALAAHPEPRVRAEVAANPECPSSLLAVLAQDPDERVVVAATTTAARAAGLVPARWMFGVPLVVFAGLVVVLMAMVAALITTL